MAPESEAQHDQQTSALATLLPRIGVRRPVTTMMTLLSLLIIGFIAYLEIPRLLFPRGYENPFLHIYTLYRGSSPQEVERRITRPIEEALATVSGIERVNSTSSGNFSSVRLSFYQGTDMNVAFSEVRDRMDRAIAEIPPEVERIEIFKYNDASRPIFFFSVEIGHEVPDLYGLLEEHLKKPLLRVDGVANLEIFGAEEKVIQLTLDQTRVRARGINTYAMIQRLQSDNFSLSSGHIYEGDHKLFVRSVARFSNLHDIEDIRVQGVNTRIPDIGDVVFDVPERRWEQRVNGNPGVFVRVFKESTANTVDVTRDIVRTLDTMFAEDDMLAGHRYEVVLDFGNMIMDAITNLMSTGAWGGLFAFMVLFYFIRRFRLTLVVALSIPLSLLTTIICLYFLGWSLNLLTLMGLMLSVGMVVDNAIVIMENILRRRSEGMEKTQASIHGAGEVGLAITMSTLTTIAVFLPVILMEGADSGFAFFMLRIGLPVMAALLASLWMALLFIPFATQAFDPSRPVADPFFVSWCKRRYRRMLRWTLRHRFDATILFLVLLMSAGFPMQELTQTDQSEGHINNFSINLYFPDNYSLEHAAHVTATLEAFVEERRELYQIRTLFAGYSRTNGNVEAFLQPVKDKVWWQHAWREIRASIGYPIDTLYTREMVLEDLKDNLPHFAGVRRRISGNSQMNEEPGRISLVLYGDDTDTLLDLADGVERRLEQLSNLVNVEIDIESARDEVQVIINRTLAQQYGVEPRAAAQTVSYLVRGIRLSPFHTEGREIEVWVGLRKEDRETLNQLRNYTVVNSIGQEVPLASFADFRIQKRLDAIRRVDGKTYVRVTATTTTKNLSDMQEEIDILMRGFEMPLGYRWAKGERFTRLAEQQESQIFAGILAVTFVFLLMGILFESFILPLSIVVCMPFAFIGGFWLLYAMNTQIDFMVGIGGIILIGVVVNNAIVLVDLVNRTRAEGYNRYDALMLAGEERLRPIMMTALTTICGLLPMAVGGAGLIGMPYAPLGRILIGGLISATIFTPLVVPLTYTFFDDLRTSCRRGLSQLVG